MQRLAWYILKEEHFKFAWFKSHSVKVAVFVHTPLSLSTECREWDLRTVSAVYKKHSFSYLLICMHGGACACQRKKVCQTGYVHSFLETPDWSRQCQSPALCSSLLLNAYWIQIIFISRGKFSIGRSELLKIYKELDYPKGKVVVRVQRKDDVKTLHKRRDNLSSSCWPIALFGTCLNKKCSCVGAVFVLYMSG